MTLSNYQYHQPQLNGHHIRVAVNGRISIDGKDIPFKLQEFVNRRLWFKYGPQALEQLNPLCIVAAYKIRMSTGMYMVLNNWYVGGIFDSRGKRDGWEKTGALDSQHKRGNAIDFNLMDPVTGKYWTSNQVFDWVIENEVWLYDIGVRAIENWEATKGKTGIGWTHLDFRLTTDYLHLKVIFP